MLDLSARKVYGALEDDISAIDSKVDNAILSMYKAGGSLEFDDLPSLSSDVANMAYLVTDAFTTTSDFVEGAGVDYPAGTYVAIVNTGTEDDPDYKYDVVPFTMIVDDTMSAVSENPLQNKVITGAVQEIRLNISNLSASKISKSETVGHVMNDGSIDENDYAEKVENATSGNLAGLDANGNLTDSGVSPTEDVTVEGNPVTFVSPFEQDAKNVVVSVKPIQAGSGTPSPENIRPISGINELEIGVSGKNRGILDASHIQSTYGQQNSTVTYANNGVIVTSTGNYGRCGFEVPVTIGEKYTISMKVKKSDSTGSGGILYGSSPMWDAEYGAVRDNGISTSFTTLTKTITAESDTLYIGIYPLVSGVSLTVEDFMVEVGEQATAFEPYNPNSHTTTIPLPSTLYDADVDVTEGSGNSRYGYIASYNGETLPGAWISDRDVYTGSNSPTTGAEVAYELATPTTFSFTPAILELLEGTNVVTTNAEKVAVTYGRSLWQDIDDLKTDTEGKLDKSDVADVEGDTASKAYSVNDFMLRSDGFYKVTQPIASGASITSSNTTKTTIGAVLTALLNA